jgi:hypothetical protein
MNMYYTKHDTILTDLIGSTKKSFYLFERCIRHVGGDILVKGGRSMDSVNNIYTLEFKTGATITLDLTNRTFYYHSRNLKKVYSRHVSENTKWNWAKYKCSKYIEGVIEDNDLIKVKKIILKLMLKE